MFLFGKSKRQDNNALRSGTVERVPSRMLAIPKNGDLIADQDTVLGRLHDTDEITVLSGDELPVRVAYKGEEYELEIADVTLNVSPDDPSLRSVGEKEREWVLSAEKAVGVEMFFADNNMDSYHLQVKMLDMLVPDMAALLDDNSYRIHSGRWAVMTAASHVAPSPDYMYCIHCVNDDGDSVWIHTHGLTRCGTIELEILGATTENYGMFGNALNQIAHRLVGDNRFIGELEPKLVGVCGDGSEIVATWQRSEWSFKDFPKNIMGGPEDRDDEHSLNMGVVYLYENEKAVENGKITPIIRWEKRMGDNDIYYKTTDETHRMRALAQERLGYLREMYEEIPEKNVLVKLPLTPDEKYGMEEGQFEYIWFKVDEMREDGFTATLTQDAFYVDGMVEGVRKDDLRYEDIVDWRVYTPEGSFEPDNVFRYIEE